MGHRNVISDEGYKGWRSGYASSTTDIVVGRIMALKGGAATAPDGTGGGFGQIVDYPAHTQSMCIGISDAGAAIGPGWSTQTIKNDTVFHIQDHGYRAAMGIFNTGTAHFWLGPRIGGNPEGLGVHLALANAFQSQMVALSLEQGVINTNTIAVYISTR